VISREEPAVVEVDALAQANRPRLRVLARHRGGERRTQLVVVVVVDEPFEQRTDAPGIGIENRRLAVDDLLVGSSLHADPERAAPLQRRAFGRGQGVRHRQVAERSETDTRGGAATQKLLAGQVPFVLHVEPPPSKGFGH
jgi:hypothetical protein